MRIGCTGDRWRCGCALTMGTSCSIAKLSNFQKQALGIGCATFICLSLPELKCLLVALWVGERVSSTVLVGVAAKYV
jgi:hypothetical protein